MSNKGRKHRKLHLDPFCAQCGKPSVGYVEREGGHRVWWCETHFPSVYQIIRKRTQKLHERFYARFGYWY